MIDFDEEIKKFKPSLEVGDVEEAIEAGDLKDMMGIMEAILNLLADKRRSAMEKRAQTWTRAAAGVGYLSNRHYNQGLALARQKKLSKAQRALEISLKYNKYNKDARNLLGLIEYSRGEAGQAVAAWEVSAGLKPENNIEHRNIKAREKCPKGR